MYSLIQSIQDSFSGDVVLCSDKRYSGMKTESNYTKTFSNLYYKDFIKVIKNTQKLKIKQHS